MGDALLNVLSPDPDDKVVSCPPGGVRGSFSHDFSAVLMATTSMMCVFHSVKNKVVVIQQEEMKKIHPAVPASCIVT